MYINVSIKLSYVYEIFVSNISNADIISSSSLTLVLNLLDIKKPIAIEARKTMVSKIILTTNNIVFILQFIYFFNLTWFLLFSENNYVFEHISL